MALQGSGSVSFSDIAAEFGDSTPHSMSEFYRNGSLVPNATQNQNIPTSGAISVSGFYGATNRIQHIINITSNTDAGLDLLASAQAAGTYTAGITDVYVNISSGVYVGSPSDGASYAITADGFTSGDIVHIVNNGYILGRGGTGGGGSVGVVSTAPAGNAGGRGIYTTVATNITNNGTIAGGGGGGGGAGGLRSHSGNVWAVGASGGGGGAGYQGGTGGAKSVSFCSVSPTATNGSNGTTTSGGAGGRGTTTTCDQSGPSYTYSGGTGGNLGQAGSAGATSNAVYYDWVAITGGAGGQAGYYLVGNSHVNWIATGTRLGQVA
jgi:hypothetical protein